MKSTLITRVVAGTLVASSAFLSTNYLMGQTAAPAAPAAASQAAPKILASVNGQEISTDKFNEYLMAVAGMRLFEQVENLILAERACFEAGIDINGESFKKNMQTELDRALSDLSAYGIPEKDRLAALDQILRQRGITAVEFQMGLRRGACLRALAAGKVTITDANVKDAYEAQYGEKLQGRMFVVPTLDDATAIRKALETKTIDEVTATYRGAARVIPMSVKGENIDKVKTAALAAGVNKLSAAIQQTEAPPSTNPPTYVLFYLEKKEPSTMDTNKFDTVKDKVLGADLLEQGERTWANQQLQRRAAATVKINDPVLSAQYEAWFRQQQAASSQPATAPASAPAATMNK